MAKRATIDKDEGSEGDIQKAVSDYARGLGWRATKRSGFVMGRGRSGEPDYDYFRKGREPGDPYCFMIEFKRQGKPATELQDTRAKELRECGVHVYLCDNRVQGKMIVDDETRRAVARERKRR